MKILSSLLIALGFLLLFTALWKWGAVVLAGSLILFLLARQEEEDAKRRR